MSNNDLLDKDFNYYIEHQQDLLKKYNGKVLIIQNQEVIKSFDDYSDAYFFASSNLKEGSYLIQTCTPGKDDYTQTFHSRVVF